MLQEVRALQPQLLPQSSLSRAVSYLINEPPALIGYLESGTYLIDNNLVENSIHGPAVGRRPAYRLRLNDAPSGGSGKRFLLPGAGAAGRLAAFEPSRKKIR